MVDRQKSIKPYCQSKPLSESHLSVAYLQRTASKVLTSAESSSSFAKKGSCVVVINHYTTALPHFMGLKLLHVGLYAL